MEETRGREGRHFECGDMYHALPFHPMPDSSPETSVAVF